MADFARIYDSEEHGQILVKKDQSETEDGAEVRFYIDADRYGLGICAIALTFPGDDGWGKADAVFAEMTQDKAEDIAGRIAKQLDAALEVSGNKND